jgi:SAM-dependent MidA family methyltransferase
LQPDKLFSEEAKKDLKPGDSIEICPEATSLMKELSNIVELSRGMALLIDYGEDHAFSNSFRGVMNHKLVKDDKQILANVGNIDLTAYVNFRHLAEVARLNTQSKLLSPSARQWSNALRILFGGDGHSPKS